MSQSAVESSEPEIQPSALASATPVRVASVDVFRGLTIFLMIFVNDLGHAAPGWMHHIEPSNADGMTLADIVFPWFLFIVGVSIPLALERSRLAGVGRWAEVRHILGRTLSLLLMGLVAMNHEEDHRPHAMLWGTLAFTALVLAWLSVGKGSGKLRWGLKIVGIVGLIVYASGYRSVPAPAQVPFWGEVASWGWMRIHWWGILGLIGWAYLVAALVTLCLGRRREWLMGTLALLMVTHLAMNQGGFFTKVERKTWLQPARPVLDALRSGIDGIGHYVNLGESTGSLAAIAVAGALLGSILRRSSDVATPRSRLAWTATFALGLALAGFVTDTFEGINKNAATPSWCFYASSLACLTWMILYLIVDVAGFRGWSLPLRLAGENPLVAYFLHPVAVGTLILTGLGGKVLFYQDSPDLWVVIGGSLAMALVVCSVAGLLGRLGFRVRV